MKTKSKRLAMLLFISLIVSLFGCTKQDDSMVRDLESLETTDVSGDAGKETTNQLRKQLHVPDKLQMDILNDKGQCRYKINAEIDMPIEAAPCVYQQRQVPFSKEEIIKRAKGLFDSGEFSYVKPIDCYTMDELNEELAQVEKQAEEEFKKKNIYYNQYYLRRMCDLQIRKENYKESDVREFKEGDFIEGTGTSPYDKIMIMEGEIGGDLYYLKFFTCRGHECLELSKLVWGEEHSMSSMDNFFGYSLMNYDLDGDGSNNSTAGSIHQSLTNETEPTHSEKELYGENECSYTEEEAGKLALQYAALLGDTDMVIARTNWCLESQMNEESESPYDSSGLQFKGYAFYLQRQYGKLMCNDSNYWWREATEMDKETSAKADPSGIVTAQEAYRVVVTDQGVVSIETIEPRYEITKTLSDSTSLMDFTDVQELAQGYFEQVVRDKEAKQNNQREISRINEVILRYATVLYDGEYTLIPCWFFNQTADTSTAMVINAIDGSEVFSCRSN